MKVYVSTVIKNDDKILLIQEGKPNCYGKWNVPSGHLEENEDIFAAAVREAREETGLNVKLVGLLGVYNNQFENNNSIQFSFLGEVEDGSEPMFDGKEILDAKWVEMPAVSEYDLRDREYFQDILDKIRAGKTSPLETFVIR